MRYEVMHPNGIIYVTEADSEQKAAEKVAEGLHEDVACAPKDLIVSTTPLEPPAEKEA